HQSPGSDGGRRGGVSVARHRISRAALRDRRLLPRRGARATRGDATPAEDGAGANGLTASREPRGRCATEHTEHTEHTDMMAGFGALRTARASARAVESEGRRPSGKNDKV